MGLGTIGLDQLVPSVLMMSMDWVERFPLIFFFGMNKEAITWLLRLLAATLWSWKGDVPKDKANVEDEDGRPGFLVTSLSLDAMMFKEILPLDLQLYEISVLIGKAAATDSWVRWHNVWVKMALQPWFPLQKEGIPVSKDTLSSYCWYQHACWCFWPSKGHQESCLRRDSSCWRLMP